MILERFGLLDRGREVAKNSRQPQRLPLQSLHLRDVASNQIVRSLHGYSKVFLVVIEQLGVRHHDEWDSKA